MICPFYQSRPTCLPVILYFLYNHFLFLQGCDFWDWKWRSAAADPSGSASCFPFKTPHQWRPREWADGAQGPGQCRGTYELFTGRLIKRHSCLRRTTLYTHLIRGDVILSWLCLPAAPAVLGAHHRRGSKRQHVSARAILRLDTTTPADTRHTGVLWRPEPEAVTHSRYQWRSAGAQLCSGEG